MNDAIIHLRVPAETKARWVRESRAEGKRLTDWICEAVEKHMGKTMITSIELTQSGVDKFNTFFAAHAKTGVSMQAVTLEMLDIMQDRASMDESLSYELGRQYTLSGNPEILRLDDTDIRLTIEDDE